VNDTRLHGKRVLVTGAAGGLGQAFVLHLARLGARVLATDVRPLDGTSALAREQGAVVATATADVSSAEQTRALAEAAREELGGLDALVSNAAIVELTRRPFDEVDEEEWDRVLAVNAKGPWLCAKAVVPLLREAGGGAIVNVSSEVVWSGSAGLVHYVTSKAAVIGLTRALARELGPDGICVNTLTPDYIAFDRDYDNRQPGMAPALAAQRVFAREQVPEDLLGTLLYLLGPGSDFVTGQDVWVNGGRLFH
jgi:3-oxoacyl-[acyl-carrier protein] reductase